MTKIILDPNHYFYTSTNAVNKIGRSFFDKQQIVFFDYTRFYKNGDFYGLTVNADAFRIYFELEYESLNPWRNLFFENDKCYHLFFATSNSDDYYARSLGKVYSIMRADHGFTILKKYDNFADQFFFASLHPHHIAINYYLNQLPTLNKFIYYFQDAASQLMRHASENRISLPNYMIPKLWNSSNRKPIQFNTHTRIDNNMALTKRETECLNYLCKGYTTKEIASLLNLSPRTIETYLENIKLKFNIRKKSDLIKYVLSTDAITEGRRCAGSQRQLY